MTARSNPWEEAVGAWVPLAELLDVVKREFGIEPSKATALLRHPMETAAIGTRVEDWELNNRPAMQRFVYMGDGIYDPYFARVSHEGWKQVDFGKGLLIGHRVLVRWADVKRRLSEVAPADIAPPSGITAEGVPLPEEVNAHGAGGGRNPRAALSIAGGAPTRHNWDAFWIEVAIWIDGNGFERASRTALQKHMQDWSAEQWKDAPHPSTIREKLKALFDTAAAKGVAAAPK